MVHKYNNNLIRDIIQEYDDNLLNKDPTENDVELNTDPSTNNDELNTGSKNNDKYNLRRNKRCYGKLIGKVDGANYFAFVQKIIRKTKTKYGPTIYINILF